MFGSAAETKRYSTEFLRSRTCHASLSRRTATTRPATVPVVTLNGRNFYLGEWQSDESKATYARLIVEYLANGRTLDPPDATPRISVAELIELYWVHLENYFGEGNREVDNHRGVMRILNDLYGENCAHDLAVAPVESVH